MHEPARLTAYAAPTTELPYAPAEDSRLAPAHVRAQGDVTDPAPAPAAPPPRPPGGALAPPQTAAGPPPPGTALTRAGAGLGLLGAAVSGAAGYWLGGGYGAGAGVLYFGVLRNAVRTASTVGRDGTEAAKAGTVTLLGLAGAGFLTYRAVQSRRDE